MVPSPIGFLSANSECFLCPGHRWYTDRQTWLSGSYHWKISTHRSISEHTHSLSTLGSGWVVSNKESELLLECSFVTDLACCSEAVGERPSIISFLWPPPSRPLTQGHARSGYQGHFIRNPELLQKAIQPPGIHRVIFVPGFFRQFSTGEDWGWGAKHRWLMLTRGEPCIPLWRFSA